MSWAHVVARQSGEKVDGADVTGSQPSAQGGWNSATWQSASWNSATWQSAGWNSAGWESAQRVRPGEGQRPA